MKCLPSHERKGRNECGAFRGNFKQLLTEWYNRQLTKSSVLYSKSKSTMIKLMRIISHTIKDGDVISLIRKYLVSGVMVNGEYENTPVGTPQGGNLSPLLSNIMLNELDKELEARGLRFVRYADSLIFVRSEQAANRVLLPSQNFIEKKLGLKVNVEKSKISRPNQTKFLGFSFYYDSNKRYFQPRPHGTSVQKFQRKLRQLTKRNWGISLDMRIVKLMN